MYGKNCFGASVVIAYAHNGDLRDAYRCVTGAYGSLMAVDYGTWRLEGIRMCTSHPLDRKDISTGTDPNRRLGLWLLNTRRSNHTSYVQLIDSYRLTQIRTR